MISLRTWPGRPIRGIAGALVLGVLLNISIASNIGAGEVSGSLVVSVQVINSCDVGLDQRGGFASSCDDPIVVERTSLQSLIGTGVDQDTADVQTDDDNQIITITY